MKKSSLFFIWQRIQRFIRTFFSERPLGICVSHEAMGILIPTKDPQKLFHVTSVDGVHFSWKRKNSFTFQGLSPHTRHDWGFVQSFFEQGVILLSEHSTAARLGTQLWKSVGGTHFEKGPVCDFTTLPVFITTGYGESEYYGFFGGNTLGVAQYHHIDKEWKIVSDTIKPIGVYTHYSQIHVVGVEKRKEGFLVFFEAENSQYERGISAYLLDKKNPAHCLWWSETFLLRCDPSMARWRVLGMWKYQSQIFFYYQRNHAMAMMCIDHPLVSLRKSLEQEHPLEFRRSHKGVFMEPRSDKAWERQGVFNPGSLLWKGITHLFYRAIGSDGVSRIGHATVDSTGQIIEQSDEPVYALDVDHIMYQRVPKDEQRYNVLRYRSGGGWGGCEDPRVTFIDGKIYLIYNEFQGWHSVRIAFSSLDIKDFEQKKWKWSSPVYMTPEGQVHKNWVLFPEKINGKYAWLHNLHHTSPDRVLVEYTDDLDNFCHQKHTIVSPDPHSFPSRQLAWHHRMRGVGTTPLLTEKGWLVFYHATDQREPYKYKVGALLLDKENPERVIARASRPVLFPQEKYEHRDHMGIVYVRGAVIENNMINLYYGARDAVMGRASASLQLFLEALQKDEKLVFAPDTIYY